MMELKLTGNKMFEMVKEHTLILMGKNMWVNGRVVDLGSENYMTKTETSLESG